MPDNMMRVAGRGKDGKAKAINTDNQGNLSVQSTPHNESKRFMQEEFTKGVFSTPLVGEILKDPNLSWFYPLTENSGNVAHDIANSEDAEIKGDEINLTDGAEGFRYVNKTNKQLGLMNIFSPQRGIRVVNLNESQSFSGKSKFTVGCVFEPNSRKINQMLISEGIEVGSVESTKFSVVYNHPLNRNRITVQLRTKHSELQSIQSFPSTEINPEDDLKLLHVTVDLENKTIKIYFDGYLDSEHRIEVDETSIFDSPTSVTLGNIYEPPKYRFHGTAGYFFASNSVLSNEYIIKQAKSFLVDEVKEGGEPHEPIVITEKEKQIIFRDNYAGYYEIHVDDSILFLEELDANKEDFNSIFDGEILKRYKKIHDQYGTVFHLSLFYEIVSNGAFDLSVPSDKYRIGWDLSEMTDKFKDEFRENSHWLKFSLHSQNYDIRYSSHASRSVWEDYKKVRSEVFRFASRENWQESYTKLHWYRGTENQLAEMAENGVHRYVGSAAHATFLSYDLTSEENREMYREGYYHKDKTDVYYLTGSGVVERIMGLVPSGVGTEMTMDEYLNKFISGKEDWKKTNDYLSLETHEQWHYGNPAVFDQVEVAAKWMYENNYMPRYLNQGDLNTNN